MVEGMWRERTEKRSSSTLCNNNESRKKIERCEWEIELRGRQATKQKNEKNKRTLTINKQKNSHTLRHFCLAIYLFSITLFFCDFFYMDLQDDGYQSDQAQPGELTARKLQQVGTQEGVLEYRKYHTSEYALSLSFSSPLRGSLGPLKMSLPLPRHRPGSPR